MLRLLFERLDPRLQREIRRARIRLKRAYANRFRSYGCPELLAALRSAGIVPSDTVIVHSGFSPFSGFRDTVTDWITTFLEAVGPSGHLAMVSMAYRGSTREYLETDPLFDVRRTISMMGLPSEAFRRRASVLRSLNPAHPILVTGPDAGTIVAGHEDAPHSCGIGTPFETILARGGKVVFFDVPPHTFTFLHHIEHRLQDRLPFPLYAPRLFPVRVVDAQGTRRVVPTYAFSKEASSRRRPYVLFDEIERRGLMRRARVGGSRVLSFDLDRSLRCAVDLADRGILFHV